MASITIRPTSGSGSSWSDIANAYDTNTSTVATVSLRSFNYSSRTATFNISLSSIPTGSTITSATLTINAMASADSRITLYADINESSSSRVINQSLTTTATNYTANITSYISSLSTLKLTGYISSYFNTTLSVYDISITVEYTEASSTATNSVFIGSSALAKMLIGTTNIISAYVGNVLVYGSSSSGGGGDSGGGSTEGTNILPVFSTWTNELTGGTISGDYSMTASGGGLSTLGLNMVSGTRYTFKVDAIGSQTYFYFFDSNLTESTVLQITPIMLTNNEYTFTASTTYTVCVITNWDDSSYSLSVTNVRIFAS